MAAPRASSVATGLGIVLYASFWVVEYYVPDWTIFQPVNGEPDAWTLLAWTSVLPIASVLLLVGLWALIDQATEQDVQRARASVRILCTTAGIVGAGALVFRTLAVAGVVPEDYRPWELYANLAVPLMLAALLVAGRSSWQARSLGVARFAPWPIAALLVTQAWLAPILAADFRGPFVQVPTFAYAAAWIPVAWRLGSSPRWRPSARRAFSTSKPAQAPAAQPRPRTHAEAAPARRLPPPGQRP